MGKGFKLFRVFLFTPLLLSVFLLACEKKIFGSNTVLENKLRSHCSKWELEKHSKEEGRRLLFRFKSPSNDVKYDVFVRFEGEPVEEIYVLWNRIYGTKDEDKALKCAINFVVVRLCQLSFEDAFEVHKLVKQTELKGRLGEADLELRMFDTCDIFVDKGKYYFYLMAKPNKIQPHLQ